MPTYHYRCKSCSYEFEELQKISDEPLRVCPSCQRETVVRVLSGGAGLVFKGSGFYQTDYKKSDKESKKELPGKKEGTAETKGESKPEVKPETRSSESGSSKGKGGSTS